MSKMRPLLLGLACLLVSGFSSACVPPTPPECRAFLNLPREQRHADFRTYELEKQLDVYLCAMKAELRDVGLADEVANRGEAVIGPVIAKLKSVPSEVDKYEMIHLLEIMSERGYLRGKKDVILQISDVIATNEILESGGRQVRFPSFASSLKATHRRRLLGSS